MTEAEIIKELASLREHVFTHAAAQTALPRPRKTRLAVEALKDPIMRLENQAIYDDWEETFILLYCHRRLKPARTHGRLSRMETRYAKQGNEARFASFFDRVKQTLYPDFITSAGYNRTFGEKAGDDIFAKLDAELEPVVRLGKPIILYAGTLLGHVREGGLIDHDDDVDFAVYLGESTLEGVAEKWIEYQRELLANDCLDTKLLKRNIPVFKVKNNLGIAIDLFPAWTENGRFSVYPYSMNALPESAIFPLKSLDGGEIMLPKDAPALLAQSYGDNWRIPDPLFHFNWGAARRKFAPMLQHDFTGG